MKREEVLKTLKLAAPALLGENDAVLPILKCLKFTGTHVIASNDVIGICLSTPITEKGIVSGRSLINFLSACNSKDVEFSKTRKNNILVKCASPKLNLATHPEDEWPFEFPDIEKSKTFTVKKRFFKALDLCSAQSPDTGLASWQGGIIFVLHKNVEVFGIGQSRATISHYNIKSMSPKFKKEKRIVVPSAFCKTAVSISKTLGTKAKLHLAEDAAVIEWGDGDNIITTKFIHSDMPDVVARYGGIVFETGDFIPITDKFKDALKRASTIGDKGTCQVLSEKKGLLFKASGGGARLNDLIRVKDCPTVEKKKIAADLICKRLENCTTIAFGTDAAVMKGEDNRFTYVVANRSASNEQEED